MRTYGYACPSCNCLLEFFGLSHDERRVCAHCGSMSRLEAGDLEWRAVADATIIKRPPVPPEQLSLGPLLRHIRSRCGVTMGEASAAIGLVRLSDIERGIGIGPTDAEVEAILRALDPTVKELSLVSIAIGRGSRNGVHDDYPA